MWYRIFQFLIYLYKGQTNSKLHSPFVFQFYQQVLHAFSEHKEVRKYINNSNSPQNILSMHIENTICSYFINSKIPPIADSIILKSIEYFQCENIVLIGSALNKQLLYINNKNKYKNLILFYNNESNAEVMRYFLDQNSICATIYEGDYENSIKEMNKSIPRIDMVYFGETELELLSLKYIKKLLENIHDSSIFIFENIHKNKENMEFFEYVKTLPEVTISIDLYYLGILFFTKKIKQQQSFILKF